MQNNVSSFLNQQYGLKKWNNYDYFTHRLRCRKDNAYTQLISNDDEELSCDTPIFACKFAAQAGNEHFVALANEDGKLGIHNCKENSRFGIQAHNNAIFDLCWMFDQMKIVTASGDHTAKLYDLHNGEIQEIKTFYGHTRSIKTVSFRKDDSSVFATGGRDGNIILWDTRTDLRSFIGKADQIISNSHICKVFTPSKSRKKVLTPSNSGIKSVTGLVFQNENTLVSCGAGDGKIKIWDLRKHYSLGKKDALPKSTIEYSGNTSKNGFSCLQIDKECLRLYVNCLDNNIYCYNLATYDTKPIQQYVGHENSSFYIKSCLSFDGNYMVSGSSDKNAYIWNLKHSKPLVKLTGHNAEVTCVAWSYLNQHLVTCSDDMTHKIYMIDKEEFPDDWAVIGSGQAETIPFVKTPIRKRMHLESIKEESPKKFIEACSECGVAKNCLTNCENCTKSNKRKYSEELSNENKRINTEFGPRRLFTNLYISCDELAKTLTEENPSNKYLECFKASISRRDIATPLSPTLNLPNFVIDGTAPHLNYSPPKKKSQDWLTKLRVGMKLKRDMFEKSSDSEIPGKIPKLELTPSRKFNRTPKSSLLGYFKISNGSRCESLACSSKNHTCNYSQISSPKSNR